MIQHVRMRRIRPQRDEMRGNIRESTITHTVSCGSIGGDKGETPSTCAMTARIAATRKATSTRTSRRKRKRQRKCMHRESPSRFFFLVVVVVHGVVRCDGLEGAVVAIHIRRLLGRSNSDDVEGRHGPVQPVRSRYSWEFLWFSPVESHGGVRNFSSDVPLQIVPPQRPAIRYEV